MVVLVLVALVLAGSVDLGEMVVVVAALKLCMRGGMCVLVRRVCLGVVGARVLVGVSGGLTVRLVVNAGILVPGGRVCLGLCALGVSVVEVGGGSRARLADIWLSLGLVSRDLLSVEVRWTIGRGGKE